MVVFVDLDEGDENPSSLKPWRGPPSQETTSSENLAGDRPNPNYNGFSAALSCYPIVSQLARLLDLNSLADLSLSCRQFHANLIQFRNQLVAQTLRCENERSTVKSRLADRFRESRRAWNACSIEPSRIVSGRVGQCARDLVGPCRKCDKVVCRNCIVKPPQGPVLAGRHRRLCRTCLKAPLSDHTAPLSEHESSDPIRPSVFTYEAFARSPCHCADTLWICQACGSRLRSFDDSYIRGWKWRGKYTTYLGGLGTGIGEGNEGVECGKGESCLAAREVEHEIDCDPKELEQMQKEAQLAESGGHQWSGTSYMTQEIEGIGGVVKTKVKKRVKLGAVVREYEDERDSGEYLSREREQQSRNWCAWCSRVIPSRRDMERQKHPLDLERTVSGTSTLSLRRTSSSESSSSEG